MNKRLTRTGAIFLQSVGALVVAVSIGFAQQQTKPLDPANLDTSVKPTDDFYQYANGGWLKNNPIPADQTIWASFQILREKNTAALHGILEEAAKTTASKGSNMQKVGDLYYSGMDSAAIEAAGAKPLQPEFDRIAAIKTREDLVAEITRLQSMNIDAAFNFGSGQDLKNSESVIADLDAGGLGLPDRDYYFSDDEAKHREQYLEHIAKMFTLLGDDAATAKQEAKDVLEFETGLAKVSMTRVDRRDPDKVYHKMTLSDVNALTPNFSWTNFYKTIGVDNVKDINVAQPEFFKHFNEVLASTPIATWKTYLRWELINRSADYLSNDFVMEDFNFYGKTMNGQPQIQPRWKRISGSVNGALGEALGQLYVEKYFPPAAKKAAREMIENLRTALHDRIVKLPWMSEETKKQALRKLAAFGVKVGYPDKWRDYSKLEIDRGPYVLNMERAAQWAVQYQMNKIGKPVDKTEWGMTPPTVNAYYSSTHNEIVFPAGILQPPFFDFKADDAVNYGGMGAVIGHEMTHGFDDQGRKFDADGNLKDWWTEQDAKNYKERSHLIEEQYNNYVAVDTFHLNGKFTLGENTADLGGLTVAYAAFKMTDQGKSDKKIDGFTPDQRFFLAWAQVWRNNIRPEAAITRVKTDPHSSGKWRTNGPISNMQEFFNAFGAKDGDPMVRSKEIRAQLW